MGEVLEFRFPRPHIKARRVWWPPVIPELGDRSSPGRLLASLARRHKLWVQQRPSPSREPQR